MNVKKISLALTVLALVVIPSCSIFRKPEPAHDFLKACPNFAAYPVNEEGSIGGIIVYNNGPESFRINRNVCVERKVGGKWVDIQDNSGFEPLSDPWWDLWGFGWFPIDLYRWRVDPADMEGRYRVTVPVENDDRLVRCEFKVVQDYDKLSLSEKLPLSPFSDAEKSSEEFQIHIDPAYTLDPATGSLRFEYTMKNMTDHTLITSKGGSGYRVEVRLGEKWYLLPFSEGDELIPLYLYPQEETGPCYALLRGWYTNEWPEGEYRLMREVTDGETNAYKRYFQTFELKYQ